MQQNIMQQITAAKERLEHLKRDVAITLFCQWPTTILCFLITIQVLPRITDPLPFLHGIVYLCGWWFIYDKVTDFIIWNFDQNNYNIFNQNKYNENV